MMPQGQEQITDFATRLVVALEGYEKLRESLKSSYPKPSDVSIELYELLGAYAKELGINPSLRDQVLKRVDNGTYGICIECKEPVERVRVIAKLFQCWNCLSCQRTAEERQNVSAVPKEPPTIKGIKASDKADKPKLGKHTAKRIHRPLPEGTDRTKAILKPLPPQLQEDLRS